MGTRVKFAYADPPYIGVAHRYVEKTEVDHAALIQRLCDEYPDGWALSCSSTSLQQILAMCPSDVRVMAWVKGFAAMKKRVRPQYCWEPVILRGGRPTEPGSFTIVRDWFMHNMATKVQFAPGEPGIGAKPEPFCFWVLDTLGYQDGDTLDDIFPGSGIMGYAAAQGRLSL